MLTLSNRWLLLSVVVVAILIFSPQPAEAFYQSNLQSHTFSNGFQFNLSERFNSFRDRADERRERFTERRDSFSFDGFNDRPSFDFPTFDFGDRFDGFPTPPSTPTPEPGDDEEDDDEDIITVPNSCPVSLAELTEVDNFPPADGPIIAFGDSLTAGVGAPAGQSYVDELEDLLNTNVINEGISGDTTEDALDRLESDVLARDPAAVIVWLGGNDILQRYYADIIDEAERLGFADDLNELVLDVFGTIPDTSNVISRTETFNNLETIIERIQATGAITIVVGYDGEALDQNLNSDFRNLAEATDSIFISDVLDGIIGNPSLTSDFFHPNAAGYDIVADRMDNRVSCTLASVS